MLLDPPTMGARPAPRPHRRADRAEPHGPLAASAPLEPPNHPTPTAPFRSGWTRVAKSDTVPSAGRVRNASRPEGSGVTSTRAFTFSAGCDLRRRRRVLHRRICPRPRARLRQGSALSRHRRQPV